MKLRYFFTILLVLPALILTGCKGRNEYRKEKNMGYPSDLYHTEWQEVEAFRNQSKPKSALEIVETIYKAARKSNNVPEYLKAVINKMALIQQVEEESIVKVQEFIQDELSRASFPADAVLHSLAAQMYWEYYSQNRYTFYNRTETGEIVELDMRTWSLDKIIDQIVYHYSKSLENPEELQKIGVDNFEAVIQLYPEGRLFRPTLYDFLAHRALDFYMDSEAGLTRPGLRFNLNDPVYLGINNSFVRLKLSQDDEESLDFLAIKLFQELIKFHLKDKVTGSLLDVDIKRLKFVYSRAVLEGKQELLEDVLKAMIKRYSKQSEVSRAYAELANHYFTLGNTYYPGQKEQYRWYLKKALELCEKTIADFPAGYGSDVCRALKGRILEKSLYITAERYYIPNQPLRVLAAYKNMKKLHFKVVKTSYEEIRDFLSEDYKKMAAHYRQGKAVQSFTFETKDEGDYQQHSAEIPISPLQPGTYVLLTADNENFDTTDNATALSLLTITDIAYIQRNITGKGHEIQLFHRETGAPLAGCQVQLYFNVYDRDLGRYVKKKGELLTADKQGYLVLEKKLTQKWGQNSFFIEFIHDDQHLFVDDSFYIPYNDNSAIRGPSVHFFTDRAIYRPGQALFFKGIILNRDTRHGEKNRILPDTPVIVRFYDVNRQTVGELEVTSNKYGTFSGAFKIPEGVLTGTMQLYTEFGSTAIQVEEYKRPGFEVLFDETAAEFQLDEKVSLTGKATAFGGFGIDNATVNYRVERTVFYPYLWYRSWFYLPPSQVTRISSGRTQTDSKGAFSVTFDAVPDASVSKENMPAFSYTLYVDITDINGETRSSMKTVTIGYTSLVVSADFPEVIDKDARTVEYTMNSTNLSSEFLSASGTVTVFKLTEPANPLRKRLWTKPDVFLIDKDEYSKLFPYDIYNDEDVRVNWKREKKVFQANFDTSKSKTGTISGLESWKEGVYLVEMVSRDSRGNEVKDIKIFTLTSASGSSMPYRTHDWFAPLKTAGEPGEEAVFLIGCSKEGSTILYEVEHRGSIVTREYLKLNNEQKKITIPIKEEHRGNFTVHFSRLVEGRSYTDSQLVRVPWTNKELDITFETFRSTLTPGEEDQWRIRIKGPGKDRVAAEMAAALYDSSLDAYRSHNWYFNIFPSLYGKYTWRTDRVVYTLGSYLIGSLNKPYFSANPMSYNQMKWFGFSLYYGYYYYEKAGENEVFFAVDDSGMEEEEYDLQMDLDELAPVMRSEKSMSPMFKDEAPTANGGGEDQVKPEEIQVRSNFAETAFFYPHLETNSEGEVIIAFKMPESITRWKMLGFAHTKELEYGLVTKELVTRKELMVLPNAPRFLREGDTIDFSAKITNQSEKELSGEAVLYLYDPATMENLNMKFGHLLPIVKFAAKEGESTRVSWKVKVPEGIETVAYRITAASGSFSDGEEKALPVLKNSMLVTETLPLPVASGSTREFTFDKLASSGASDTLTHHKLTLEFTANPAWYAVQALPYIMEYPYECNEQTFSRYYANALAAYIVSSKPAIKEVFKKWQNTESSNALLSNLEKNQELKSLLLEETPWVLDAQNETEQKRRIAFLFDSYRMADELDAALKKLMEGQDASGGWPWFKGMYANRYITAHIICGFGHLERLGVLKNRENPEIWNMINQAVSYLDRQIGDDYKRLLQSKADLKLKHIGYSQIHYFYMRSFFSDIKIPGEIDAAYQYYKKQLADYQTEFNIYARAMIALTLHRDKRTAAAREIIESIKEHALYSDEMGMYWKESHGHYWYEAGVETQALLIEAFLEITNDTGSVEKMQTWLLKNKQTRNWRSTKATAEACYALLLQGTDLLTETRMPDITIGGIKTGPAHDRTIDFEEATGHFKTSWDSREITPEMGRVTITNNNKVPAWGGLYWQYFEQLDKITFAQTNLSLKKELFVETAGKKGPVLVPLSKRKPAIGDRIVVRITLVSDRDMEYVHMKDMRAAAFEPENVISRYKWQDGLGYYEATRDGSTNFFFDFLPKGTFVFEYPLRVTHEGDFSAGIATIGCMYAPEFTSHSEGVRVTIPGSK